MDGDSLR